MRHFERAILGGYFDNLPVNPAQPFGPLIFVTQTRHQLHSDANAQERAAFDFDRFNHGIKTARCPQR